MRIWIAVAGLMLAACGQAETPETPVQPEAVETPAPEAVAIGGVDLTKPARALGTEPFWGIAIMAETLTVTGVDRPEIVVQNPGAQIDGETAVIAAKLADGGDLVVTLRAAECSDGMSDWTYPLEAEVKLGAETLKGCADSQASLDARPRP